MNVNQKILDWLRADRELFPLVWDAITSRDEPVKVLAHWVEGWLNGSRGAWERLESAGAQVILVRHLRKELPADWLERVDWEQVCEGLKNCPDPRVDPDKAMPGVVYNRQYDSISIGEFYLSRSSNTARLYRPGKEQPWEVVESGSWEVSFTRDQAVHLRDQLNRILGEK